MLESCIWHTIPSSAGCKNSCELKFENKKQNDIVKTEDRILTNYL